MLNILIIFFVTSLKVAISSLDFFSHSSNELSLKYIVWCVLNSMSALLLMASISRIVYGRITVPLLLIISINLFISSSVTNGAESFL